MARPVVGKIPGARERLASFRHNDSRAELLGMVREDVDGLLPIISSPGEDTWEYGQIDTSLDAGDWGVVAVAQGHYLGYCLAKPGAAILEILQIAVNPAHRRKGLGRRMINFMCEAAKSRGMDEVWLEVRASNLSARALYGDSGFIETGVRNDYYGAGDVREAAIMMSRLL